MVTLLSCISVIKFKFSLFTLTNHSDTRGQYTIKIKHSIQFDLAKTESIRWWSSKSIPSAASPRFDFLQCYACDIISINKQLTRQTDRNRIASWKDCCTVSALLCPIDPTPVPSHAFIDCSVTSKESFCVINSHSMQSFFTKIISQFFDVVYKFRTL